MQLKMWGSGHTIYVTEGLFVTRGRAIPSSNCSVALIPGSSALKPPLQIHIDEFL